MTAGGPNDAIWFTNVIYHGHLYTLTKRWKGIPANVLNVCHDAGAYSLADYNNWLKTSSFVGPEVLEGRPSRVVNHFRAVIVEEPFAKGAQEPVLPPIGATPNQGPPTSEPSSSTTTTEPGLPLRFPVLEADFYVARTDPQKIVKVLHFGWQNYYDPNMDEWLTVQRFSSKEGKVVLPSECTEAAPPSPPAAGSSSS
jgi:hypothetical protein